MAVDLACRAYGEGPTVVILHGLFGSARNWATVARALGERYHVLTVDLRNHGDSPWADEMGFEAMAEDLDAFLAARNIRAAAVIGHSMGGKTAMMAALTRPDRIAGLLVADIAPIPYRESLLDHVEAAADLQLAGTERRAELDEDLSGLIPEPGTRAFILQNVVQEAGRFRWRVNLQALRASANAITDFRAPHGARYDGPCLFIAGARSDYIMPRHHDAIATLFPAAKVVTVADAGHYVHADQPERFVETARAFLRSRVFVH